MTPMVSVGNRVGKLTSSIKVTLRAKSITVREVFCVPVGGPARDVEFRLRIVVFTHLPDIIQYDGP